jgi:hypothetical protein
VQRDGFDTSKLASDCWRATLRRCHGVEPACGNDRAFPSRNGFEGVFVQRDGFDTSKLASDCWRATLRRCHGLEPACGNDGAFPCRNGFEAYLCSVMGLIPQSLLRIVGGQRSVVAMVWNRRVETTERFPPELVSRRICAV